MYRRSHFWLAVLAVLSLAVAILNGNLVPLPIQVRDGEGRFLGIAYADRSGRQRLDLYLPDAAKPYPVIVYIHGGGFRAGNKRAGNAPDIIRAGLDRGYAVASLNYRLSGEATYPAAVEDVFAAIKYLKTNAADYDVDSARMATWGDSAGGNLASMAATRGSKAEGTDLQAAVNWFGPIVFDQMDSQFETLGIVPMLGATSAEGSPESTYLGVVVGTADAADLAIAASPQTYISPDDPPMIIQHGTADRNVPILQSENFAAALSETIGPERVVFDALEVAGHGGGAFLTEANFDRVFAFLDTYLKDLD